METAPLPEGAIARPVSRGLLAPTSTAVLSATFMDTVAAPTKPSCACATRAIMVVTAQYPIVPAALMECALYPTTASATRAGQMRTAMCPYAWTIVMKVSVWSLEYVNATRASG